MKALAVELIDIKILLSNDGDADLEQPPDDAAPRGQNETESGPSRPPARPSADELGRAGSPRSAL